MVSESHDVAAPAPAVAHVSAHHTGPQVTTAGVGFIVLGAVICFLASMSLTLAIPVMLSMTEPKEQDEAVGAAWATYLPLILAAGATPVMARLSDLYGRRRIVIICLTFSLLGSIIGPLGADPDWTLVTALIGRSLQGIGCAIIPVMLAAARELLSPARMISALSVFGAGLGMGGILGAPLGGIIYETVSWRPAFWATAVVTAVVLMAAFAWVPVTSTRLNVRFDWRGAILLPLSVMVLLTCAFQAPAWGWGVVIALAVGLTLLGAWIATALRTRSPLANLRAFRHKSVWLAHVASAGIGWILMTNTLLVALELQSAAEAPRFAWVLLPTLLVLLPCVAALLFVGPCSAMIAQHFGPKALLMSGALLAFVGFVLRLYAAPTGVLAVIWATVIAIGASFAATSLPMILNIFSSAQRVGALNGMNWLMRMIGTALGASLVIHLATSVTVVSGGLPVPDWQTMWIVLLVSALISLLVVLCTVLMPMPARVLRTGR